MHIESELVYNRIKWNKSCKSKFLLHLWFLVSGNSCISLYYFDRKKACRPRRNLFNLTDKNSVKIINSSFYFMPYKLMRGELKKPHTHSEILFQAAHCVVCILHWSPGVTEIITLLHQENHHVFSLHCSPCCIRGYTRLSSAVTWRMRWWCTTWRCVRRKSAAC